MQNKVWKLCTSWVHMVYKGMYTRVYMVYKGMQGIQMCTSCTWVYRVSNGIWAVQGIQSVLEYTGYINVCSVHWSIQGVQGYTGCTRIYRVYKCLQGTLMYIGIQEYVVVAVIQGCTQPISGQYMEAYMRYWPDNRTKSQTALTDCNKVIWSL